jgi:glucose-6-phosphate isomerase
MGLIHLAIVGVDIKEIFSGVRDMFIRCSSDDVLKNPAYMYALLHTVLYHKKAKSLAILMPFSQTLKSTADWYVQLLAESLGKKYHRKIELGDDGIENWLADKESLFSRGRTPISAAGTNDLHSIQQNNVEGEDNKVITFIRVEEFRADLKIPGTGDLLSGKSFSSLMHLAQEATEWALVRESRPNCTIILPKVSAYYWGALLIFFEMATAFEGELLNVNAFDQPGVEGYKNYMYYKLGKPGISKEVVNEISSNPLKKEDKYII